VDLEEKVELEGLTVAHELSSAEDYDVVGNQRDNADLECRERRLSLDEAEVLGLVARDGLEAFLENRP